MKKVIIVGGGISGLTAGIVLQKSGFETHIYEKNPIGGGELTGWKRDGIYIDNCIDWLTNSKADDSEMYALWKDIGMLGEDIKMCSKDKFFSYTADGKTVTFWRDLERTRKEMLEISPDDEENIEKFINTVKIGEVFTVPANKPMDKFGLKELKKFMPFLKGMGAIRKAYAGMSLQDLADSFKSPVIGKAFTMMHPANTQAFSFIVSYATITSGSGDIPVGGSLAAALRICDRYKEVGGTLHTNCPVKKIVIAGKAASGVLLEDGTEVNADYVIAATDANHCFTKLLPAEYMPKKMKAVFDDKDHYSTFSKFHAIYLIDGKVGIPEDTSFWKCDGPMIGRTKMNACGTLCYDYDPETYPTEDKTLIQVKVIQYLEDCLEWIDLASKDKAAYDARRKEYADRLMAEIVKRYPEAEGKIRLIDTWTPATYASHCNSYNGAYMSFVADKDSKTVTTPGVIKQLKNVFLAGQWNMGSGGLPPAAVQGKFAAWRICKKEGVACK